MDILRKRRRTDARSRGSALTIAVTAALAVMAISMLAACSAASSGGQALPRPGTTGTGTRTGDASVLRLRSPVWLLTRSALSKLISDPTVRDELQGSQIYEILQPGQQPLPGVTAEPVVTFASSTALQDAISSGQLPASTFGVLYDPEAWSFTPVTEQRDPVLAATRAAAVAHAHGLHLIVSPALNLTTILKPGSQEPRWRQFLSLNLAGRLARIADFVELQAQSLEQDTATYTAFVQAATSQASAANPRISVLAGLSTNPPGAPVDSEDLTAAVQATRSMVDGYWLNIPGQGARCLTCEASRPDIAIQFLQALY